MNYHILMPLLLAGSLSSLLGQPVPSLPAGALSLVNEQPWKQFQSISSSFGKSSPLAGGVGRVFSCSEAPASPYGLQGYLYGFGKLTGGPLLIRMEARALESANESGKGSLTLTLDRIIEDKRRRLGTDCPLRIGPEWKTYWAVFNTSQETYYTIPLGSRAPAGATLRLTFRWGAFRQKIEIRSFAMWSFPKTVAMKDLPRTKIDYEGRQADAPWRAQAETRIEKIRKSNLSLTIVDEAGKPVPGAKVHASQTRQNFLFGFIAPAKEILGRKLSPEATQKFLGLLTNSFNTAVLPNELKWPFYEKDPDLAKAGVEQLAALGLRQRGHCLLYPGWQKLPPSLKELSGQPAVLRETILRHIDEEAQTFAGRFVQWDVLNEPYDKHDIGKILGDDFFAECFRHAHAADPQAKLFLNDGCYFMNEGRDTPNEQYNEKLLKQLLAAGAPIDGIGMQGHFGSTLPPISAVVQELDRFAALGLRIMITEYDLDTGGDEELQTDFTRDFFTACFSHPAVDGFISWGYESGDAALLHRDLTPKPSLAALLQRVHNNYQSDMTLLSDADGRVDFRLFQGDYVIEISTAKASNRFNVALGAAALRQTLSLLPGK